MATVHDKAYFEDRIVDSKDATLNVASAAVLYGLSVYTVLPALVNEKGTYLFRLKEHYERLVRSAHIIGLDTFAPQWSFDRFSSAVSETVKANHISKNVFVRITVHVPSLVPGVRSRGLPTALSIFLYDANSILPESGTRLKTSIWRRTPDTSIPSRAKVNGAYVNSVLARQEALDAGYDDAIFLDANGEVCELSAANLFMVRDGKLYAPCASKDILEGINRRTLIELAEDEGIEVIERGIDLTELYIADELFACGTSAFVTPVIEVDARRIASGTMGTLTKRLLRRHQNLLAGTDPLSEMYLSLLN